MACEVCHKVYTPDEENCGESDDDKPHLCKICGHSFSLKIQLKRHLMLHTDGAPYTCKNCAKENEKKGKTYNLRLGNKNEYLCDICHKSFGNKRMLLRHSIQHTFDRTSDTEEGFGEIEKVVIKKHTITHKAKHKSRKSMDASEFLSCHICEKNFQSWLALEKHTLTHNVTKTPKTLKCKTCNKAFAYQACLDKHVKKGNCIDSSLTSVKQISEQHNDSSSDVEFKKHTCNICGKNFARKSSLEGHELCHILSKETSDDEQNISDGEDSDDYISQPKKPRTPTYNLKKSYTCDRCNFVCFSKPTLEKHYSNHKEKDLSISIEDNVANNNDSLPQQSDDDSLKSKENRLREFLYECEKCDKKFKTKGRLINHKVEHIKREEDESEEDQPITLFCETCNEKFSSKKDLKIHLLFHSKKDSNSALLNSGENWSKQRKPRSKDFECELCGKRFAGETCLKKHMLRHKPEVENEGETSQSSSIKAKKHKPVKELICEFCNEEFTGRRGAYVKHIHAHTPEVCGICDERFVDRQGLREHCKIHVGTEEGKMFMQCSQKALDAKNGLLQPEPKVEYIYLVLR